MKNNIKTAVIGIDVEDWYHLDYLKNLEIDKNYSMMDGLNNILEICEEANVTGTLFTVGEIANKIKSELKAAHAKGFEIASHGYSHKRPLTMTTNEFSNEIHKTDMIIQSIINEKPIGFRAPCFSLNDEYLDVLIRQGYKYDSSKIKFKHYLYGNLELKEFKKIENFIYKKNQFMEFEIPTVNLFNKNIPFSGGGYLRLFNFGLIKYFINILEENHSPLFMYLHPYEFSSKKIQKKNIKILDLIRMSVGKKNSCKKLSLVLNYMLKRGWEFKTFKEIYNEKKNFDSL